MAAQPDAICTAAPPPSPPAGEPLRELRVNLQLEVRIWGIDCWGKAFSRNVRTVEISALGGRLSGVGCVQQGDIIGIQYGASKARFRVVWIGAAGSEQAGTVGVECVEPGKCIWTAALEEGVAAAAKAPAFTPALPPGIAPAASATLPGEWPERDRRRFPRVPCAGTLRVKQAGTDFETTQKLTDISLGGCYGESMASFARETQVEMVLELCGERIVAKGMVRTHHPSMGNGIGFTQVAAEDWKKLVRVIQHLGGGGNLVFEASGEPTIGDAIEALLSLLEKKGVHVTRDEFLDELKHRMAAGAK